MAAMSAYEQLMLEMINRARLDPLAEAARLGIDLNQGLAAGTLNGASKAPLAFNGLLVDSSRAHSQWMIDTDTFSHTGSGGSDPGQRMTAAGYQFTGTWTWGENIRYSATTSAIDAATHASMTAGNHDALFRSAGHRTNILGADFREIGVGERIGPFTTGGTTYNAVMVTENFARSGDQLRITGVVIRDLDGDNFYDIGEGRGGVSVAVTRPNGSELTSTGTAGGYNALAAGTGNHVVTFSGGGLPGAVTATVVVTGENVKLDLLDTGELASSASTVLGAGAVSLRLLGLNNINGTGNALNNTLIGNKGANVLHGGTGVDRLEGGLGNDTYVTDGGDTIVEGVNAGIDRVSSYASHTLGANVEHLTLLGTAVAGTGNALNNILVGNASNNTLNAGAGNDYIYGGLGNDALTGGLGLDYFYFTTAPNAASNRDTITDFTAPQDTIVLENAVYTGLTVGGWLSTSAPGAFWAAAGATSAHDANDRIIYNTSTGGLYYDRDGIGGAAAVQFATVQPNLAITAADFLVI